MKLSKLFEDPRKRKVFFASAGALAAAGLGTFLYATLIEPRRYQLDSIRVDTGITGEDEFDQANFESGGVEESSQRLRILHLSDLHLSSAESHKLDFLARITESQYDLIVITGDVFEDFSGLPHASRLISRPPRLGTYAVLGNHDCFDYNILHRTIGRFFRKFRFPKKMRDVTPIVQALEEAGIHVLRNSTASFPEEKLHIVGIDYPGIADGDLRNLVSQVDDDYLVIALMHVPNRLNRLHEMGIDIAFGGHTHGGQVRIPFWGPIITDSELPRREGSGLVWRGSTAIHVSRGVGADPRTNIRLFCRPHATIIEVCHRRQQNKVRSGFNEDILCRTQKI